MSGETVFNPEDLRLIESGVSEPKYRTGFDRNIWIWKEYDQQETYMISADVARGDGKDYSTFHIFNTETMELVAEYRGKTTPDVFANVLFNVGKEYGDCLLAVENNSVGWTVITKLEELQYPNLYYARKTSHEYVDALVAESSRNTIGGFTMSRTTRPLVIAKFEEFIRNKLIKINSSRLYNEMKTFVWQNGRAQAMKGFNDDLIMACAIGCWIRDSVFVTNVREGDYQKAFLSAMTRADTKMNTTIPGMIGYKPVKDDDQKKQDQQFGWILKG